MTRRLLAAAVLLWAGPALANVRRTAAPPAVPALSLPVAAPAGGLAGLPSGAPGAPAAAAALPWFIQVADPRDAAWLSSVLQEAQASKTARATLRQVEKTAARLGRPVIVEVRAVPYESFDYDTDVVTLKASLRNGKVLAVPSILMHELTHFAQKEKGMLDTFELELEAYITDFKVAREMGHTPKRGNWEDKLHKKFGGDIEGFLSWLKKELYEDVPFAGRLGRRAYGRELAERLQASQRRLVRINRRLEKARAVVDVMRSSGQDPQSIETYHRERVAKNEGKGLDEAKIVRWVLRDLETIADPVRWRRFSAYSRRVMKRLTRLHDEFQRSGGW